VQQVRPHLMPVMQQLYIVSFTVDTDASCIEKPTYKQIIVAPSIGLVIAATMHSGFKRKRYRIGPRLRLSYMGRPLNLERFSHYVDTLDSTEVVKVVIDIAYIGDVASIFYVLAHTQQTDFNPSDSITSVVPLNGCSNFESSKLSYDHASLNTMNALKMVGPSASSAPLISNASTDGSLRIEGEIKGIDALHQGKEVTGCDWDNMISDASKPYIVTKTWTWKEQGTEKLSRYSCNKILNKRRL
nr:protein tesmin/TSO1-like CXC 2 isoform X2 [Tanacetum cinerariifolium]